MPFSLSFLPQATAATKAATEGFVTAWQAGQQVFLLQTSGSTGTPKQLQVPRMYMEASALATAAAVRLERDKTALVCLNPKYIAGQMALVRGLMLGWAVWVTEPSNSPIADWLSAPASALPLYHASMVPLQLQNTLADTKQGAFLKTMHSLLVGGAPISPVLQAAAAHVSGVALYQTFGMSETVSHVALRRLNGTSLSEAYTLLPGFKLKVDACNCLAIAGPTTGGAWLQTTDVVQLTGPDSFIWQGRADFVINSGGLKIYPEQLEALLAPLLQQAGFSGEFYITARPHQGLGQSVALVLESVAPVNTGALAQILKQGLPLYHAPKSIEVQPVLARTPTGKVVRQ